VVLGSDWLVNSKFLQILMVSGNFNGSELLKRFPLSWRLRRTMTVRGRPKRINLYWIERFCFIFVWFANFDACLFAKKSNYFIALIGVSQF